MDFDDDEQYEKFFERVTITIVMLFLLMALCFLSTAFNNHLSDVLLTLKNHFERGRTSFSKLAARSNLSKVSSYFRSNHI